eukprot:15476319-Alexandrium_andersonii.AAC.1
MDHLRFLPGQRIPGLPSSSQLNAEPNDANQPINSRSAKSSTTALGRRCVAREAVQEIPATDSRLPMWAWSC